MKLRSIIVHVHDAKASASFYERALGLGCRFVDQGGHYAEVEAGPVVLGFSSRECLRPEVPAGLRQAASAGPPGRFQLSFTTDDVGTAFDRALAAGALSVTGPQSMPSGQHVASVRDPDGVLLEFVKTVG